MPLPRSRRGQAHTYLHKVFKGKKIFEGQRLLVWDTFASHESKATQEVLKELNIEVAFVPCGCTTMIQAPDVSWNKPLKQ